MRVPNVLRDCVVYVYDGDDLLGTGFLVGVPVEPGSDRVFPYVVTARHLVESSNSTIVSLNALSGEAIKIDTQPEDWRYAQSGSADVAAAFLHPEPESFGVTCVRFDQIADDNFMSERDLGPGDDVVFIGLLKGLPGRDRNRPIVRFGQIAMMNEELIPQETPAGGTQEIDAIMVEARSWGGQSGAPAFVVFSPTRYMGSIELVKQPVTKPRTAWALLGLVSGHWELPSAIRLKNMARGAAARDPEREAMVNSGVTLVAPAQHIVDLLMREDVAAHREELKKSP